MLNVYVHKEHCTVCVRIFPRILVVSCGSSLKFFPGLPFLRSAMASMSPELVQLLAMADVNHVACRALEAQGIYTIGVSAHVAPTRVEVVPAILGDSSMASGLAVAACLRLARQMAHVLSRNATMPRPFSVTQGSRHHSKSV